MAQRTGSLVGRQLDEKDEEDREEGQEDQRRGMYRSIIGEGSNTATTCSKPNHDILSFGGKYFKPIDAFGANSTGIASPRCTRWQDARSSQPKDQ